RAPSIPDLPTGSTTASMIVSPPPRVSSGSLTPPAAMAAAIARRTAAAGSARTSAPPSPALSFVPAPVLPTDDRPVSPEPVGTVMFTAAAADADANVDNEPPADDGGNEVFSDRGMSPVPFTLSRRMSKRYKDRKSKVMTMVPSRQSLLDTFNVLSAMAAAHPTTDDSAPTLPDMPDHWRARLASVPDDGPVVPAPTIPLPDLPTSPTAGQDSTRRESRWSGPTVIHPALLKFIEESERLDRERSPSSAQPERGPGSSTNDLTALIAAAAVAPESGLAQMLHDGSLAPHELEAIASLQVTPATLAVALDAFVESQDPASLYTDVTPYAEGNSGDVYVARDAVIQTTVAIKIIPRDADRSRDKVARLPLEIYLLRASRSPDLVAFIGAYLTPTDVWVVSEFMDAGCLADYLYDDDDAVTGGLYADGIAYLTTHLFGALACLHAAHRIHRDVRSDNLLLTKTGAVKLGDFGYATELRGNAPIADTVGTPYWMAPEMAASAMVALDADRAAAAGLSNAASRKYGMGVDVWAAGITVFEMAARAYPYSHAEDEVEALQWIATQGCPPVPEEASVRLGESGVAFVKRATAMDPKERPSAAELLQDAFLTGADMGQGRREVLAMIQAAAGDA
ncbi:STE/STE20 protein kinase, partial [Allomyces macrogynus ATCC 38327]